MLTLFHNDMSVCAQKVRMVLEHKGLPWNSEHLNLRKGDQFQPNFIKISPKALVPVLVDGESVINESNAIIQYIDEAYPDNPLMPADAFTRALVRKWLIQIDANLHVDVATISVAIAFRDQIKAINDTPEKLNNFYAQIPDPQRAALIKGMIEKGLHFEGIRPAVLAYDNLLKNMNNALVNKQWLVGQTITLADFAYAPYITRLAHLNLAQWWSDLPHLAQWLDRIIKTKGYQQGLLYWNNPDYLTLMSEKGQDAWGHIAAIIEYK
jgi:glutathione S-transferase